MFSALRFFLIEQSGYCRSYPRNRRLRTETVARFRGLAALAYPHRPRSCTGVVAGRCGRSGGGPSNGTPRVGAPPHAISDRESTFSIVLTSRDPVRPWEDQARSATVRRPVCRASHAVLKPADRRAA